MGQKDISLVRYFEDQDRFADLINGFVFRGEQTVLGKDIQEMDSRVTGVFDRLKKRFMVQKYRDCVRRVALGTNFVIFGVENQDKVHYAMPVRIMLEDAAGYDRHLVQIRRHHRTKGDLRGAEFLGGFSKEDRIHPVATICIYYGKEPYDGAKELYQLMEYESLSENIKGILNNYKIQVLEVSAFQDIDLFETDLREVFGFIQRSGDMVAEQKFTNENEERFKALDEDAFDVIVSITGASELEKVKEQFREEGGKINMCEAIRGMIEQGREEGIKEGIKEGIRKGMVEGQKEKAYAAAKNMFTRGFSAEETAGLLEERLDTVESWYKEWSK